MMNHLLASFYEVKETAMQVPFASGHLFAAQHEPIRSLRLDRLPEDRLQDLAS